MIHKMMTSQSVHHSLKTSTNKKLFSLYYVSHSIKEYAQDHDCSSSVFSPTKWEHVSANAGSSEHSGAAWEDAILLLAWVLDRKALPGSIISRIFMLPFTVHSTTIYPGSQGREQLFRTPNLAIFIKPKP